MGYLEIKPAPTKTGVVTSSSPAPSSVVAADITANPTKEEVDSKSEAVKTDSKSEISTPVLSASTKTENSTKGSGLSAKAPAFQPSGTTGKSSVSHDAKPPGPSGRSSAQASNRGTAETLPRAGQANQGAASTKGEEGAPKTSKMSNVDTEVCVSCNGYSCHWKECSLRPLIS